MFSANVQSVTNVGGVIHIIFIYANELEKRTKEYIITTAYQDLAWLKIQVKSDLDNLNNIDPEILNLRTGPFDPNS